MINDEYEKYMIEIPLVPEVAQKIMQLNDESETFSSRDLSSLIVLDPYLSASILKIANSALYSRRSEIKDLYTAVNLIGFKKIRTMVLLLAGASLFKRNKHVYFYQLFWQHSIISAFICRDIAKMINPEINSDEFFTASLIHRIGQVPLYLSDTKKYLDLIEKNKNGIFTSSKLEMDMFQVDSCQIGAALLSYWDFPESLIITARYAGSTESSYSDKLVDIVTLSDYITIQNGFGISEYIEEAKLQHLLNHVGLTQIKYDYFISELYIEKLKNSVFFKECQNTLNVELIPT